MIIKSIKGNEVVNINEIRNFEQKTNIILPEELVLFYTEICNGCEMLDGFDLLKIDKWKYDIQCLQKDFLFEKYWVWEDNYDIEKFNTILNGNIELINIGDSQSWNIIVKGKEKGKMWFFTDVGIQPCAPPMSFFEWFEFWLDDNDNYFYDFIY